MEELLRESVSGCLSGIRTPIKEALPAIAEGRASGGRSSDSRYRRVAGIRVRMLPVDSKREDLSPGTIQRQDLRGIYK